MTSTKWQRAITSLVPTLVLPPEVIQYTNMAVLAITAACFTLTYRNRFATALRIFLAIPALMWLAQVLCELALPDPGLFFPSNRT